MTCAWAVAEVLAEAADAPPEDLCIALLRAQIDAIDAEPCADAPLREAVRRLDGGTPWTEAGLPWNKSADVLTRVVPVAVVFGRWPVLLHEVTRMVTAPTHGHPSALAAGQALATMLGEALAGHEPAHWGDAATRALSRSPCGEVVDALQRAALAARTEVKDEAVEAVGQGYVAEEALARAWASVLRHPDDPRRARACARGESATAHVAGALTGALWGAQHGAQALPESTADLDVLASRLLDARVRLR
jgi:ADP-ribosylglycohydrolase